MKLVSYLCMPEGDGSRETYAEALEMHKRDNRRVLRAMLAAGEDVPDAVSDLGARYAPARHRFDEQGRPVMEIFGVYEIVQRGVFSCGCAAAYEAAVLEEKYGIICECIAVPQGDNDFHAVVVTEYGVHDPIAAMNGTSTLALANPPRRRALPPAACEIIEGRVVCVEPDECAVDERGVWRCPRVPGLTGRRERIGPVQRSRNGQAWARTRNGAVVPVRRSR